LQCWAWTIPGESSTGNLNRKNNDPLIDLLTIILFGFEVMRGVKTGDPSKQHGPHASLAKRCARRRAAPFSGAIAALLLKLMRDGFATRATGALPV
jgi:hypothetical protein